MPEGRDFTNTTGRSEAPPRKLLTLSRATSRKTPEGTSRPYEREIGKRSLANGQEPNLDPKGSFINENDLEHLAKITKGYAQFTFRNPKWDKRHSDMQRYFDCLYLGIPFYHSPDAS